MKETEIILIRHGETEWNSQKRMQGHSNSDLSEVGRGQIQALSCGMNVNLAGLNLSGANDVCTFIESGSMAIAWDGGVSPCTPLMHTHGTHLKERKRDRKSVV